MLLIPSIGAYLNDLGLAFITGLMFFLSFCVLVHFHIIVMETIVSDLLSC